MRSYSHKGILMPTPRFGAVHFGGAALTADEARLLAADLNEAAQTSEQRDAARMDPRGLGDGLGTQTTRRSARWLGGRRAV